VPVVQVKQGHLITNSRDVAAFFGKDHKNVLADIERVSQTAEISALWFQQSSYEAGEGFRRRSYPCVDMTRDGFTILVMGYTGADAMRFKVAYIGKFNEMEQELRSNDPALPNFANPAEAARAWAAEYEQRQIAQVSSTMLAQHVQEFPTLPDTPVRMRPKERIVRRVDLPPRFRQHQTVEVRDLVKVGLAVV
jgi:Rha family phage regulatory protein